MGWENARPDRPPPAPRGAHQILELYYVATFSLHLFPMSLQGAALAVLALKHFRQMQAFATTPPLLAEFQMPPFFTNRMMEYMTEVEFGVDELCATEFATMLSSQPEAAQIRLLKMGIVSVTKDSKLATHQVAERLHFAGEKVGGRSG